ncbi:hypothetical protein ACIPCF_13085 [Paracoccus marcusii]|uniref:hypothetical protein n=1 Tax=Paracoccus marcusii TaxID=59779 RepID=UPI0038BCCA5C
MIRPDLRGLLRTHSELLIFAALALAALWVAFWGGWFFAVLGGAGALVAGCLALGALRRTPFRRPVAAPGVVEIVEGAIRYYGATDMGGEIPLRDLVEIRLLRLDGHAHWRLRSQSGEALLIPADAAGAGALADAFTALPGLDMGAVSAALAQVARQQDAMRTVWRRPG